MNAQPAILDPPDLGLFAQLDSVPALDSWKPLLAAALLKLGKRSDLDLALLSHLTTHLRVHRETLQAWEARQAPLVLGVGIRKTQPVGAVLVERAQADESFAGLDVLLALLCEFVLREDADLSRKRLSKLAQMLHGTLEKSPGSALQVILQDAATIPEIQAKIEHHLETSPSLYISFEQAWKGWLRDRLTGLILNDPASLRRALAPPALTPSLDAPELPVQTNPLGDADDVVEIPSSQTLALDPGEVERSPRSDVTRARAAALTRASQGDLLASPDDFAPHEVITALAGGSILKAQALQARGSTKESEPFVALALTIATGLRESDLVDVCWESADRQGPAISETHPVLVRRISRPPNAVTPGPELAEWLEPCVEQVAWPLPQSLHQLLLGLTAGETARAGKNVFPRLRSAIRPPYQLREIMKIVYPGLALGSSAIRQALAAHLARNLGPDVAQLALGDTFSMSTAATYYSAPQCTSLLTAVRALQTAWFGQAGPLPIDAHNVFGSRLVLTDDAARRWANDLQHRRRSTAHRKNASLTEAWIGHRDFLAASLCAVTGHRPVDAIGQIDLDQVIPEYGLIILRDKQVDPLRKVRIAVTGARWLTELRSFLDRLIEVSAQTGHPGAAKLATAILRSEAPLFSIPGPDDPVPLTAATLRASMPEPLRTVANHYRHRLNQQLQNRGVDPELRYAQLGWVVSPAHATADLSPLSARDLAAELGAILDDILLQDGWFTTSQRTHVWRWDGIPLRPLADWDVVARAHEAEHRDETQRLRRDLHERGKLKELEILPLLARAIREFLPSLRLDESKRVLIRAPELGSLPPLTITDDLWLLICDRARQHDDRPTEAFGAAITRILLHRLLKKSHRAGLTCGALPRRPIFSLTTEPSPFLPGSGLAVRHAELLRQIFLEWVREGRAHDQGALALLAVLLFSPYRDPAWARAAVNAAADAKRGQLPGDCLRIPATLEFKSFPMTFSGVPALLLARRGVDAPKGRAPDTAALLRWLGARLPPALTPDPENNVLDALVQTVRAAGRIELSGPERLLMLGALSLTAVSVDRCLAAADAWPVQTRSQSEDALENAPSSIYAPEDTPNTPIPPSERDHNYRQLTELLNPRLLPKALGKVGDGRRGWRGALADKLSALRETVSATSTLGLVIGFSLHCLRYGGAKKKQLEHTTLHTYVTRFAYSLLRVIGTRTLLGMDSDGLQSVYLAILLGKPPRTRPLVLESLRAFQAYLEDYYQVDAVPWGELASLAGPRADGVDAGLLTDPELHALFEVLQNDIVDEQKRTDASPDFVRLAELRLLLFVLLEASGARPASIRGLLLGDLYLFAEGRDFIHLHKSGDYGSVKTASAIGFIPLEGALWARTRLWVIEWLTRERSRLTDDAFWKSPLFADVTGGRRRYSKDLLQFRIGTLIRWVSNENKARVYWLRKCRIMARHRTASGAHPARARDVHAALCASGQAGIGTPITSYISDPAITMAHSLREGRRAARADILDVTGLKAEPMDMAWLRRGGAQGNERLTTVFERLPFAAVPPPERHYTAPPAIRRQLGLLPTHIDVFARALHQGDSIEQAMLRAGLSALQAGLLQNAAADLVLQRGQVPWHLVGLRHPRAVMRPPRRLPGTEGLFKALERQPAPALQRLATAWVSRGHMDRLVEGTQLLPLINEKEVAAAREALGAMGIDQNQMALQSNGVIWTLRIDRPYPGSRVNTTDQSSLSTALAWTLAMVWLHQQMHEPLHPLSAPDTVMVEISDRAPIKSKRTR